MKICNNSCKAAILLAMNLFLLTSAWGAGKDRTIHVFSGTGSGGEQPSAIIFDSAGNIFGATKGGGSPLCGGGCGTVFEMTPISGGWTYKPIYGFRGVRMGDGSYPNSLVFDKNGNLFGTTNTGGMGGGTIFELTTNSSGGWTETLIYSFPIYNEGGIHGLTIGPDGNFYGTTVWGGTENAGTVFQLVPNSDGSWTVNTILSFGAATDGGSPEATVTFDQSGNLYGTNENAVYELTPTGNGQWHESVLHLFTGDRDGILAYAPVIFDKDGNLYGTTSGGDGYDFGTVYMLQPVAGGWSYKVIWNFRLFKGDGGYPLAPITPDGNGNLYGTTSAGGNGVGECLKLGECGRGTVFRLSPNSNGGWSETAQFRFDGSNGEDPDTGILLDQSGNLYGATYQGGTGYGVIYELIP